jgi:outer membrane lipoprotein carrier protein
MRLPLSALLSAALAVGAPVVSAQAPPPAAELAARLQRRYESIRDFSADFEQTYRGILLRQAAAERGKVLVKKPGRIRFTYEAPEPKLFVSDGTVLKTYYPEERAGSITTLPAGDDAPTALLFLAGRGDLARDFTAALGTGAPAGEWRLGLVPRSRQADFDTLTLFVDARTLALRGFETTDDQGTNTIRFSRLKENTGLTDRAFAFEFPPGTDITR